MLREFYFLVVFWGKEFQDYFLNYCLASLLSVNNIPCLENKNSKFLICTTSADWVEIQNHPCLKILKSYIEPKWIPLEYNLHEKHSRDDIMLLMSKGHCLLAQEAFKNQAYGIFVYPEMLAADGMVSALQNLARTKKYDLVQALAVRFANMGLIKELETKKIIIKGEPIHISSNELVATTLRHMHSETIRMNWDGQCRDDGVGAIFFKIPNSNALQFHTANFAPILLDYKSLKNHDTSTFDAWTLDGDYIFKNFINAKRIYLVNDSDELMLVGFSDEAKLKYSLEILNRYKYAYIRSFFKMLVIGRYIFHNPRIDALKLKLFSQPIMIHSEKINYTSRKKSQRRAKVIFFFAKLIYLGRLHNLIWNFAVGVNAMLNKKNKSLYNNCFTNIFGAKNIFCKLKTPLSSNYNRLYWEINPIELLEVSEISDIDIVFGLVYQHLTFKEYINKDKMSWKIFCNKNTCSNDKLQKITFTIPKNPVFRFAWDRDKNFLWIGINELWLNGGSPDKGLNPLFEDLKGDFSPAVLLKGEQNRIRVVWNLDCTTWKYSKPFGYDGWLENNNKPIAHEWIIYSGTLTDFCKYCLIKAYRKFNLFYISFALCYKIFNWARCKIYPAFKRIARKLVENS